MERTISGKKFLDVEHDRRYPFELEKLNEICQLLDLSAEEQTLLFDLAGKARKSIPPDLAEYVSENRAVTDALRNARDKKITSEEWKAITVLMNMKG